MHNSSRPLDDRPTDRPTAWATVQVQGEKRINASSSLLLSPTLHCPGQVTTAVVHFVQRRLHRTGLNEAAIIQSIAFLRRRPSSESNYCAHFHLISGGNRSHSFLSSSATANVLSAPSCLHWIPCMALFAAAVCKNGAPPPPPQIVPRCLYNWS